MVLRSFLDISHGVRRAHVARRISVIAFVACVISVTDCVIEVVHRCRSI